MTEQTINRSELGTVWEALTAELEQLYYEDANLEYIKSLEEHVQYELNLGALTKHVHFEPDNDEDLRNLIIDVITLKDDQQIMVVYNQFGENTPYVLTMYGADPAEVDSRFPDRRLDDNLDCIKVMASLDREYLHYVTFGLSNLYSTECVDEYSGYGFELSIRIPAEGNDVPPPWPVSFLRQFADYVVRNERGFLNGHYMEMGGPIFPRTPTKLCGFGFALDPDLGVIETISGKVEVLQLVGMTDAELQQAKEAKSCLPVIERIRAENPRLITDFAREKEYLQ